MRAPPPVTANDRSSFAYPLRAFMAIGRIITNA
jgi:hypothetical protein